LLIAIHHSPPTDYPPPPWLLLDLLNINAGTEPPGHIIICTLFNKHGKKFCVRERKQGEVDEVCDDNQCIKLTAKEFPNQISHPKPTKIKNQRQSRQVLSKSTWLDSRQLGI